MSPSSLDKVDFDQVIDETGEMLGVSPRIIRSDEDVAAQREQQANQAQMQAMAQMAGPMAQMVDFGHARGRH